MYLAIFEDGVIQYTSEVDEELLRGADDGFLDVLDISDPASPLRYWEGEWQAVGPLGE